ncbi:MAG: dethiobiotin synthase [Planctomycetaceae bacterium]|nr:dethiobiotin synthase [Planctomycetaceae bacterium]
MRGLFVTGTDTGVGKTFLVGQIARSLHGRGVRFGIYKPACSGASGGPMDVIVNPRYDDVEAHFASLRGEYPRERICPQCFVPPLAPPVAARREGKRVDSQLLRSGADWWRGRVGALIVEGAGGFLSPLSDDDLVADVARDLGFPVLIVGRLGLGTINQTLLTIEAIQGRGLPIAGIVLNQPTPGSLGLAEETNPSELERLTDVPLLGISTFMPFDRALWSDVAAGEGFSAPAAEASLQSGLRQEVNSIRIDWFELMREPGGVPPRTGS